MFSNNSRSDELKQIGQIIKDQLRENNRELRSELNQIRSEVSGLRESIAQFEERFQSVNEYKKNQRGLEERVDQLSRELNRGMGKVVVTTGLISALIGAVGGGFILSFLQGVAFSNSSFEAGKNQSQEVRALDESS